MWRSILGLVGAACLSGQQGIQWQRPRSAEKSKTSWQASGKTQTSREIQKVKEQCRARLIVAADTLFESGKADLTAGAEQVLSELGPMIKREGIHPTSIDGHTDSEGVPASNLSLSEQRAQTVERWLESRGYVIANVTEVHGFGTTKPLTTNETPQGRQKNRRVEIVINTCKS